MRLVSAAIHWAELLIKSSVCKTLNNRQLQKQKVSVCETIIKLKTFEHKGYLANLYRLLILTRLRA